jgi:hypothetical protein
MRPSWLAVTPRETPRRASGPSLSHLAFLSPVWRLSFVSPCVRAGAGVLLPVNHALVGSPIFPIGNFPILDLNNDPDVERTYYWSILSFFITGQRNALTGARRFCNDNTRASMIFSPTILYLTVCLSLEGNRVLFGSAGPIYAVTALYIWDSTLNAALWSLLDPSTFLEVTILRATHVIF